MCLFRKPSEKHSVKVVVTAGASMQIYIFFSVCIVYINQLETSFHIFYIGHLID